ncbi:P-loop containing nucleoside triphosphate hydrolase protein [Trichoderma citrinoviride]|uniref:P-loop containing nucleoside triphosphate hydrolase protein n=1 Tax=Trichoderma citrinoviride TaxID=58853 RepID=A0A2T4B1Z3_9HYPO|nr:P-loop containing nucleoside triphosphate hydrolase protein [Trichoderma citrinoviride]PTB63258.1 P-loop containing nucleoside triphosphate hydrolase protein [Trichoderma citrinoviride]
MNEATVAVTDVEMNRTANPHLVNDIITSFAWSNLEVIVQDRSTRAPLTILSNATGRVCAGEMLAILGPSGSGKTTLLNALAHRAAAANAATTGNILVNGHKVSLQETRDLSTYVEQEDALIGSLTARGTVLFAARLSLSHAKSRREVFRRVDDLLTAFGLQAQAHTIVGTPIKKGLSGGQKKRLGVASRLVTNPKIIFLDEPTSGLDSALSLEVCTYLKEITRKNDLITIASIHQPSSATFQQFDKLHLLSGGETCYFGRVTEATAYFSKIGYTIPAETNSADFFIDLINTDLDKNGEIRHRTVHICQAWKTSLDSGNLDTSIQKSMEGTPSYSNLKTQRTLSLRTPVILIHRSWIKSHRDVMAYGIRIAMYLGLAILMGTVFLRLKTEQSYIQPLINAIFFGGAFMSFMAVAYVPAFLEDLNTFRQERANGLVTPLSFVIANFIIGLPFLFAISLLFSVITYWMSNFRPSASAFFTWVLWLFLDLVAAESLVVLVSSIFSIFVVALATTAFANGLWMCVNGFLVPMGILNPFWKYVFHYIDYQAYVFQGMMVNEFGRRNYSCDEISDGQYQCNYPSDLNSIGKIRGTDVLRQFSLGTGEEGTWIGIMIGIIAGYRVLAYVVLVLRE